MANKKSGKQRESYRISVSFSVDCNREDLKSVCEAMLMPDYIYAEPIEKKPEKLSMAEYIVEHGGSAVITDTSGRKENVGVLNLRTLLHGVARLLQEKHMSRFSDTDITRQDAMAILIYAMGSAP